MPASLNKNTEALTPTFVFKGTVKKLKSATMKDVPVDDRTAVVTVDQIIEAPADLADYNGQDITVQLGGRQKIKTGQELIFHTVSWIYGDSIAVRSLSQEPVKDSHAAMLSSGVDPAERRAQREQQEHFQTADLVVSGKVVAVRLPDEAAQTVKGAGVVASETAVRTIERRALQSIFQFAEISRAISLTVFLSRRNFGTCSRLGIAT